MERDTDRFDFEDEEDFDFYERKGVAGTDCVDGTTTITTTTSEIPMFAVCSFFAR